jgi:tRNA(Ile)-lysidine synthase
MPRPAQAFDDVTNTLARWLALRPASEPLCVAYSGGIDSSVLLHALVSARNSAVGDAKCQLSAVHVHHGLSPNADVWAMHCTVKAHSLNVHCEVIPVTVSGAETIGIEAAARDARYAALRAHALSTGSTIVLAHHAQDQAETVLLQLLRGAGPAGLASMPETALPFARPFLGVAKAAIDDYAGQHNVGHIVDESNVDLRFARNRLRHQVWPALVSAFSSAERTLARAAQWQHESDEIAGALATLDAIRCASDGTIIVAEWRTLSSARRRNVFRFWLAQQGIPTPSAERLLEWEKQLLTHNETQNVLLEHASFAGSIRVYRGRIIHVEPTAATHDELAVDVRWLGELSLRFGAGVVHFRPMTDEMSAMSNCLIRPIKAGETWVIRYRREGDSIVLSPNSGGVTLKKVFQSADIAPWLRAEWPILTCNGVIAALPGLAVAGEFRASDGDENGVAVEWQPQRAPRTIGA